MEKKELEKKKQRGKKIRATRCSTRIYVKGRPLRVGVKAGPGHKSNLEKQTSRIKNPGTSSADYGSRGIEVGKGREATGWSANMRRAGRVTL